MPKGEWGGFEVELLFDMWRQPWMRRRAIRHRTRVATGLRQPPRAAPTRRSV